MIDFSILQSISLRLDLSIEVRDYTTRHPSPESQIVKILHQNLVIKMSPQILILCKSSPDIYRFLAKYCNFQKNIGPVEDSMTYSTLQGHMLTEIKDLASRSM